MVKAKSKPEWEPVCLFLSFIVISLWCSNLLVNSQFCCQECSGAVLYGMPVDLKLLLQLRADSLELGTFPLGPENS